MDDCFAYGQNPSQLRDRYYEAHDLIMRAWKDRETFAFNGRYNQQRYVNIWPRPIQQPHPPIWIPGGGSVETWQWCAEMDYVYCYLSYYGHKAGQATMDGYWAEMDRLGKDRNPYRAAFAQTIAVAESRDQALELYTEAAEYFFGRCLHFDPRFAAPPGYSTEATQRSGLSSQVSAAALRTVARPTEMKDLVDAGYIVIGSPKQVTEQMIELSENLNVGNLMLLMQFGNMNKESHSLQQPVVRGKGHAHAAEVLQRMGTSLVAAADGRKATRRDPCLCTADSRGVTGHATAANRLGPDRQTQWPLLPGQCDRSARADRVHFRHDLEMRRRHDRRRGRYRGADKANVRKRQSCG